MKNIIYLVLLTCFLFRVTILKSQDPVIREKIDYINSILKENPFVDNFNEITFYYLINITPEKELVVNMDFNGPFKTVLKSKIEDLVRSLPQDTIYGSSSICWFCNQGDVTKTSNCVFTETITSGGKKDYYYTDNICVMFANKNTIYNKLDSAFKQLFNTVFESGLKE